MEPRGLREAIKVNNTVLWMTSYLLVDQNDFGVIINLKFLITVRSLIEMNYIFDELHLFHS